MDLFGIGFLELVFVLLIALIALGPNRMIEVARTIGKYTRQLRRISAELPRLLALEEEPTKTTIPQLEQIKPPSKEEPGQATASQRKQASEPPASQEHESSPEP